MAKGGNTWCKKLMTKDKANKIKVIFGSSKPLREDYIESERAVVPANRWEFASSVDGRRPVRSIGRRDVVMLRAARLARDTAGA